MRVKQPEIFDPKREYKPGERAIYKGMVIIAELWTKAAQRLADDPGTLFCQRCVRYKIDRDVCNGATCNAISTTEPTEKRYFGGWYIRKQ